MATLILRPSSDIQLKHDKSGGSNGYALINESTADGDSTYISGKNSGNSYTSHTSKFLVSGTIPSGAIRITGISATINAKHDGDSANNGYAKVNAQITMQNGSGLSQKSSEQNVNTNYANYTFTFSPSTLGVANTDFVSLDNLFSLELITNSKPKSTSYKNYNVRITQAYITITYEVSSTPTYTCSAIASTNTSNARVSVTTVLSGGTATFSASVNEDCVFDGWYDDKGNRVSRDNPYTATITAHTTLYSRANAIMYQSRVGAQPQYGSASVSPATGAYGSSVTFTCTVTDSSKMFWGWFAEPEHINCVSTLPTYTTTHPRSDLVLYPYIGDPLYTTIIKCSHVYDVKPFRWNGSGTYNNGDNGPSTSLVTNTEVLKTNSIGSSTYAIQPHPKYEKDFNFAMAFHFAEGASELPDNATIVGVEGHIGLATTAGSQYYNMSLFAGEIEHLDYHNTTLAQPDETCVTTTRGSARSLSVNASPTDYSLSMPQMGTWTPNEIKNGRCGIQLDFMHSGDQSQLHIYDAEIHVKYTYTQTTYTCDAVSDGNCDVYVMDANNPVYKLYDNDLKVTAGQSATWHARPKPGYRFDGWYSDPAKTQPVSPDASYTATINAHRTLYAKTHFHARVISKQLTVPFGQGATYYNGYYLNGSTLTSTSSGSNGYRADLDLSSVGMTGLKTKSSLASTNGKEYIYAYLNSTAMNLLFPNSTAHPVSMDWYNEAGRGSATISFNLVARNPMTPNETVSPMVDNTALAYQRPSLIAGVPATQTDMRDDCILNMTKSSKVGYMFRMTIPSASKAIGVNSSTFTLYFEEYDFSAQIGTSSKGIEAVATNKVIGYEGDSVTFTAVLLPGVTWNGWYADPECTILVSADQTYTTTPDHDLTLYAGATTNLEIYSVSAVAGENITTVTCNHNQMTAGNKVEFNATVPPHYKFDGWYTDADYSSQGRVSGSASYSHTITEDTVLYAKAVAIEYSVTVLQGESGIAECTPPAGAYGTHTQLSWVSNDEWYEFDHWETERGTPPTPLFYSTQADNTYATTGSGNGLSSNINYYNVNCDYYYNTKAAPLTVGQYYTVIWDGVEYSNVQAKTCNITVADARYNVRLGAGTAKEPFCITTNNSNDSIIWTYEANASMFFKPSHTISVYDAEDFNRQWDVLSNQNPYDYTITGYTVIRPVVKEIPKIYVTPVAGEGITSVSVDKECAKPGGQVVLSAVVSEDYEFDGWYSDSSYRTLLNKDEVFTYTINSSLTTSQEVKVYARAKSVLQYIHVVAENTPENPIADRLWGYWLDEPDDGMEASCELYDAIYSGDPSQLPTGSCSRFTEVSNNGTSLLTLDLPFHPQKDGQKLAALFAHSIQENKTIIAKLKVTSPEELSLDLSSIGEKCIIFTGDQYIEYTQQTDNTCYIAWENENKCSCNVEVDEGAKAWAPSELKQGADERCYVFVNSGYELIGAFLDEDGTIPLTKIGDYGKNETDYEFSTPSSEDGSPTSITIYVKTKKVFEDTGVFVKINGTQRQAIKVYKKINGIYVEQTDMQSVSSYLQNNKIRNVF